MDQKLQEHLKNIIRPLFKDFYSFESRPLSGFAIFRDFEVEVEWIWTINNEQSLLKKRTKTLKILFPGEAIDDYEKNPELQKRADDNIIKFVKKNLENFDPENLEEPEVKWVIGKKYLFKNIL